MTNSSNATRDSIAQDAVLATNLCNEDLLLVTIIATSH